MGEIHVEEDYLPSRRRSRRPKGGSIYLPLLLPLLSLSFALEFFFFPKPLPNIYSGHDAILAVDLRRVNLAVDLSFYPPPPNIRSPMSRPRGEISPVRKVPESSDIFSIACPFLIGQEPETFPILQLCPPTARFPSRFTLGNYFNFILILN